MAKTRARSNGAKPAAKPSIRKPKPAVPTPSADLSPRARRPRLWASAPTAAAIKLARWEKLMSFYTRFSSTTTAAAAATAATIGISLDFADEVRLDVPDTISAVRVWIGEGGLYLREKGGEVEKIGDVGFGGEGEERVFGEGVVGGRGGREGRGGIDTTAVGRSFPSQQWELVTKVALSKVILHRRRLVLTEQTSHLFLS